jgi:tetratricopeptide (TPR) repeat protein
MVLKQAVKKERNLKKKRVMISEAIVVCPEDPVFNYKYGLSLERYGKYDKAISYYQKALLYNPQMCKAYVGIGDIHIYRGNLDKAIAAYTAAVSLMPDNSRIIRRLHRLKAKKKALLGDVLTASEVITVMDNRSKIPSNTPLLLTGPALQYTIAFSKDTGELLPKSTQQLIAIGQALQDDALKNARFQIGTHHQSGVSPLESLEKSKTRAHAVQAYLLANFHIDPAHLEIVWYGDTMPVEVNGIDYMNGNLELLELKKISD